jgi:hypothetical protein
MRTIHQGKLTSPHGVMNGIARTDRGICERTIGALHERPHRHEGTDEQQLVGEGIEELPERRLLLARAREHAVGIIGDRGDKEQHERNQPGRRCGRKGQHRDEWRNRDAACCQRIGEIH